MGVDNAKQHAIKQQKRDRNHLNSGFNFAEHVNGHAFSGANQGHPLSQGRYGDLTANDDKRNKHISPLQVDQYQERCAD